MREIVWKGRPTLVAENNHEINVGMGIFDRDYKTKGILPRYTMLFPLNNMYSNFTMEGVSFPLDVTFYTKDWRVIERFIARPGMRDRMIPYGTWWMYEIPSK